MKRAPVRIESLAAGGAGVARVEGFGVVFVQGAVPGELVDLALVPRTKPPRATILRVLEPSESRVEPRCKHVDACGGCDWMHIAEPLQIKAHAAIVEAAVSRALGAEPPTIATHTVGSSFEYRTRARLLVRARQGHAKVGYRAEASHDLVEIESCIVLHPSIAGVLRLLEKAFAKASGEGDASVARGLGGAPVVDVGFRGEAPGEVFGALDALVREGALAGARLRLEDVKAPATFGDPRPRFVAADGEELVVAAGGFAQPSDDGAAFLARRTTELATLDEREPTHRLELFCGSGALSVLLARGAKSFSGVELDEPAVACARENLAARKLEAKLSVADANAVTIAPRVEVVILDPPRSGALGAARAIAKSSAKVVVYVACDPATLARDLKEIVSGGFELTHLETVELFPQTSHVETIARLVRRRGKRPSV